MLESGWLFMGVVAVVFTLLALLTQTQAVRTFADADGIAIITGALGTITWGIFAYGSLNVQTTNSGVVIQFQMPALTFTAVAIAILPAYIALTGPAELLSSRYKDMQPDEY